jgi:hypothetical protein
MALRTASNRLEQLFLNLVEEGKPG